MGVTEKSLTEASATAAIAVGVGFLFGGAYIAAGVSLLIGVLLFVAYEKLNLKDIRVSEEQIELAGETVSEKIEEAREKNSDE